MPLVGPTPLFHELPVLVNFDPSIPLADARVVMGALNGVVRRLSDGGANVDELAPIVGLLVAEYGYSCRLVGRTREAIEFSVTRL
jgi:hypothetical protein